MHAAGGHGQRPARGGYYGGWYARPRAGGRHGPPVPPDDEQALAAAIVRTFDDRDAAARQGKAGRECALRSFAIGAMVRQYQQLFDREESA